MERERGTKETRVSGHIGALEHLREAPKGPNKTLDNLERRLRALTEAVGQAIRIVGVRAEHARLPAHSAVHAAAVAVHASSEHASAIH